MAAVDKPLEDLDETALVDACLANQPGAFDLVVERHRRSLYQLCYRFVGNHEDASDLVQEVFIRAFRGLRSFRGHSSIATWLYRIGVNVCLNKVGAKAPKPESLDPLLAASDQRIASQAESAPDALLRG